MAYLGKEFKYEREENFDGFIKSLGLSASDSQNYLNYRPNIKLVKNGDSYTLSYIGERAKDYTFTPGKPFQEEVNGLPAQTVFTVDGDTVTQVQDFGAKGKVTFKRTFSPGQLLLEIQSSNWDGVARRYYSA